MLWLCSSIQPIDKQDTVMCKSLVFKFRWSHNPGFLHNLKFDPGQIHFSNLPHLKNNSGHGWHCETRCGCFCPLGLSQQTLLELGPELKAGLRCCLACENSRDLAKETRQHSRWQHPGPWGHPYSLQNWGNQACHFLGRFISIPEG